MKGAHQIHGMPLICMLATDATHCTGNLTGSCALCGRGVQFRPHAPAAYVRVCRICFAERVEPEDTFGMTRETLAELPKDDTPTH